MFNTRNFSLIAAVIGASLFILLNGSTPGTTVAEASPAQPASTLAGTMLAGTIRSANGKPLEGIVVSARDVEKTFTTSVYTDGQGNYFFPVLDGGQYRVWAQAVGYEAAQAELKLDPSKDTRQDFTLKTIDDFTMQLSGAEWMAALPSDTAENRRMKDVFQHNCTYCHTPGFVLQNRFDKAGWEAIVTAMERATQSGAWQKEPLPHITHFKDELIDYLTKMRGPGPSPMKFHPLPRPTGDAARAVITEYDSSAAVTSDRLAVVDGSNWSEGTPSSSAFRIRGAHDAAVDFFGNAWVTSSGGSPFRTYAKIDTKTGRITDYKIPGRDGGVRGTYEVTIAPDGMVWMSMGGSLGRVDPKTDKLDIFDVPQGMPRVGDYVDVDGQGKVWGITRNGAVRFDPDTSQFTEFSSLSAKVPNFGTRGLAGDAEGNGWWAEITEGDDLSKLGGSDIKTGKSRDIGFSLPQIKEDTTEEDRKAFFRTPHRLAGDQKGSSIWFGDFFGQDIASVDTRTGKVSNYHGPVPYASVYDLHVDNNHVVWAALRNADRVGRFDPRTKKWTVYQLPNVGTECRNVYVDEYDKTGEVWLASWRTSNAYRLQFRTEQQLAALRARK